MTFTESAASKSEPDMANALSELTSLLLSDDPLDTLLVRVGALAAKDLPWVQSCGITSTVDGRSTTVVATDELAHDVDQLQYDAMDGPCLDALKEGRVVTISDCGSDDRYPAFTSRAADAGVRCVLALPLKVGEHTIGVLNLYGNVAHEFTDTEMRVGQLFAAQAALVVTSVARYSDQVELTGHLQAALNSRAAIDQAIGVLMAAHQCSPARAFERLRDASQHRNVKLRVIAAETLAAVQVPEQSGRSDR
ncbi:MAG: GAF and ANTAR domain-containing protein [Mycobacteriales bacterium]